MSNGSRPNPSRLDNLSAAEALRRPSKLYAAIDAYYDHTIAEEFDDIVLAKIRDVIEEARKGSILDFLRFDYVLLNSMEFKQGRQREMEAAGKNIDGILGDLNNLGLLRYHLRRALYEAAGLETTVLLDYAYREEVARAKQDFEEELKVKRDSGLIEDWQNLDVFDEDEDDRILKGYLISDDFLRLCAYQESVFDKAVSPDICEGYYPEQRYETEQKNLTTKAHDTFDR